MNQTNFKQFYLGCLAHASYLIGSGGEAAVVDPQRDVDEYLAEAEKHNLQIKHVIETHLHADFVSGHIELAQRTGAKIYFGENAKPLFDHVPVKDNDEIQMGQVTLRFLETPGHTPEGICILMTDHTISEVPQKILTGDTLFIGDVGRPDLVAAKGVTAEEMAGMMYNSLHEKILTLPDDVVVYPAHGAGSACGRNISTERSSTIGEQRKFNYALKEMSKEAFVLLMTTDLPKAPAYFSHDAEMNRAGPVTLSDLGPPKPLSTTEVSKLMGEEATLLDTRDRKSFAAGHITRSINVGLSGNFASWAGALLNVNRPIVLVTENETTAEEAVVRLARVGLQSVAGYLSGGITAWGEAKQAVSTVSLWSAADLKARLSEKLSLQVVDVRNPVEFSSGRVPGSINIPLAELPSVTGHEKLTNLDPTKPTAVICQGGYRASAALGFMAQIPFPKLINIDGGTAKWMEAGYDVESG